MTKVNTNHKSVSVIILAAGNISTKLPFLRAECECPALIPINTKPLAAYVIDFYKEKGFEGEDIHLVIDESKKRDLNMIYPAKNEGHQVVCLNNSVSVIDSLLKSLEKIDSDDIIVNLVTTIPTQLAPADSFFLGDEIKRNSGSWASVFNKDGEYLCHSGTTEAPTFSHPFTGIFRMAHSDLLKATQAACNELDLIEVIRESIKDEKLKPIHCKWIDAGHESTYYKCTTDLLNSRSFNKLSVDLKNGTIKKTSKDSAKIELERNYYCSLPNDLKTFFPRLLESENETDNLKSYSMEYYGYPNIAEYHLFWDLKNETWWSFFERLNSIHGAFRKHSHYYSRAEHNSFLLGKTLNRIESYLKSLSSQSDRTKIMNNSMIINGEKLAPLNQLLRDYENVVSSGYDSKIYSAVHGDLCFNNIVMHFGTSLIKFIDPRGSFNGSASIYGDPRYDAAKLMHSTIGGYDYIVNNRYDFSANNDQISITFPENKNSELLKAGTEWFMEEQNYDPRFIEVICAGLFLSMPPLHTDDSVRQRALFYQGINLLSDALK